MSVFLTLLIDALGTFISFLFNRWLVTHFPAALAMGTALYPTKEQLIAAKPEFLSRLKWRFWLGWNRMADGSKLFDKMVAKYEQPDTAAVVADSFSKKDFKFLVTHLTLDLNLD